MLQIILMIICICRNINEKGVREAVEAGARSPEAVQAHHGCQFNCGQCRCTMGEVISDTLDSHGTELTLLAAE
ncbi:MAG: (2Fe-2S)-binding protein [Pseudomonadota bacterium]